MVAAATVTTAAAVKRKEEEKNKRERKLVELKRTRRRVTGDGAVASVNRKKAGKKGWGKEEESKRRWRVFQFWVARK